MPRSTLTTPVAALTLTRTIAPDAITIELRDDTGAILYAEDIVAPASSIPSEPADPEQVR